MQILDFFLSDNPVINKMAFIGVLVFFVKQKKRSFRETVTAVFCAYMIACHLSALMAEITGWGVGGLAFLIGTIGGFSADQLLKMINDKVGHGNNTTTFNDPRIDVD